MKLKTRKDWASRRLAMGRTAEKTLTKRVEHNLETFRNLSDAEKKKVSKNLADGYKPLKGLKDGYCNRYACQAPLGNNPDLKRPDPEYAFMTDFEGNGLKRLYYCLSCARMFNDVDEGDRRAGTSDRPNRISYEKVDA